MAATPTQNGKLSSAFCEDKLGVASLEGGDGPSGARLRPLRLGRSNIPIRVQLFEVDLAVRAGIHWLGFGDDGDLGRPARWEIGRGFVPRFVAA
jgi:hypothetical protein